jgi:hypothetical protein
MTTAFRKIPDQVGDLWLMIAKVAEQAFGKSVDVSFPCEGVRRSTEVLMQGGTILRGRPDGLAR